MINYLHRNLWQAPWAKRWPKFNSAHARSNKRTTTTYPFTCEPLYITLGWMGQIKAYYRYIIICNNMVATCTEFALNSIILCPIIQLGLLCWYMEPSGPGFPLTPPHTCMQPCPGLAWPDQQKIIILYENSNAWLLAHNRGLGYKWSYVKVQWVRVEGGCKHTCGGWLTCFW